MCRDQCREIIRGTHRLFSRKYMFGVANIAKNFLLSKDDSKLIGDCYIRVLYSNIAKKLLHWHGRAKVLDPVSERNSVFYDHSFCIECFYSRGQQLCKFIEKKNQAFTESKSSILTGFVWNTNNAAISLFWVTNMVAETYFESAL